MTEPKVLVTCPPMLGLIDEFRPRFKQAGVFLHAAEVVQTMSEAELIELLPQFDGWIIGDDPATRAVLTAGAGGALRAIVKWGVGVDNVDFVAAKELGLQSTNTPGVFGKEVADLAMNYVGGLARQTFFIDREIRHNGAWPKPAGISLAGKVVALVGYGDIGKSTARRLAAADMDVRVYDPFYKSGETDNVFPNPTWPDGLADADFVVFTCPLNASTHHMLNAEVVPALKRGVRIVNVGRGPVIADDALIAGLESGVIHSVALDVFEVEPLGRDSKLRDYPLNIFGSHNASNTVDAVRRVTDLAIDKMFEFLAIA